METREMDYEKQIVPLTSSVPMVRTVEEKEKARDYVLTIRALKAEVKSIFDPIVEGAHQQHKLAIAKRAKFLNPLTEAETTAVGRISSYDYQQEQEAAERRRKAEEEARKQHEADLEEASKKLNQYLKKHVKIEDQISDIEGLLADPEISVTESEVYGARLSTLYSKLNNITEAIQEKKEVIAEQPFVPPSMNDIKVEKTSGVSGRTEKVVDKVTNPAELLKAVLEGRVPISVISFDFSQMKKLVNMGVQIPGIQVSERRITTIRGGSFNG